LPDKDLVDLCLPIEPYQVTKSLKRLARKTICFSKSVILHDIVIGLFINPFEFGRVI